jgi:carboxymethylenebutenolidase
MDMGKWIDVAALDGAGSFHCYVAAPTSAAGAEAAPKAAVIVIQEIFGVNDGIQAKCDHWAAKGYVALAPDLFWRMEPDFTIDPDAPGALERGMGFLQKLDQGLAIEDIEAVIRTARGLGSARIGAVGYCLGGRLAFMTATRTDADATVGYYGVMLDNLLGESHAIARPLMLHIAGADHFVPPEAAAKIHAGLDDHAKVTLHDYPGVDHGFATAFGKRRDEAAANLADARTEAFFAAHLT